MKNDEKNEVEQEAPNLNDVRFEELDDDVLTSIAGGCTACCVCLPF